MPSEESGRRVDQPDEELPGDWVDVSGETGFRFHWQRNPTEDDPYPSIRMSKGGLGGYPGWEVEIYPDPRDGEEDIWRSVHDDPDEADDRVLELMEEYPHDD